MSVFPGTQSALLNGQTWFARPGAAGLLFSAYFGQAPFSPKKNNNNNPTCRDRCAQSLVRESCSRNNVVEPVGKTSLVLDTVFGHELEKEYTELLWDFPSNGPYLKLQPTALTVELRNIEKILPGATPLKCTKWAVILVLKRFFTILLFNKCEIQPPLFAFTKKTSTIGSHREKILYLAKPSLSQSKRVFMKLNPDFSSNYKHSERTVVSADSLLWFAPWFSDFSLGIPIQKSKPRSPCWKSTKVTFCKSL